MNKGKMSTGGGKTVDAVQRILAIAERERRKRAVKEESNKPSPRAVAPDTGQYLHQRKENKSWTR
jgi:hypothetical protein